MGNRVVIFPADKEVEARAYKAWTNEHSPFYPDDFAYIRNDVAGNWGVPYLGPPFTWNGVEFAEPEGGPEMRVSGEVADAATWPDED